MVCLIGWLVGNVCLNGMFYHYDSMMMMSNDLNVH